MNRHPHRLSCSPVCPICHSDTDLHLCSKAGFEIFRCPQCAADFVWPMPQEKRLAEIYAQREYFEGMGRGGYEHYDEQTEGLLPFFGELLSKYEKICVGRSILDIGCSYGSHLALAELRDWKCFGVEVSEYALNVARERHGAPLFLRQRIEELLPQQFDLVLLFDVIEHLPDPYRLFCTLRERGMITSRTHVLVMTPNARSFDALADPGNWVYRHPPTHLVYYSARALDELFCRLHFLEREVTGTHPAEMKLQPPFPDESPGNAAFAGHAGLLCEVTGLTESAQDWSKSSEVVSDSSAALLRREQLENYQRFEALSQTRRQVRSLERKVESLHQELEHTRGEFRQEIAELKKAAALRIADLERQIADRERQIVVKSEEIATIRSYRIFKLAETAQMPFSLIKFARMAYLLAAMATPQRVRIRLHPLSKRIKGYVLPPAVQRRSYNAVPCAERRPKLEPAAVRSVSIVIPTKNAGLLFREVLSGLKKQRFDGSVEIIIVDSGSTDQTRELAHEFGARVIEVAPADFDHGLTRNQGVQNSSGDAVILMTQDAVPGDEHLIANLANAFQDPDVAGAYARQVPRAEADVLTRRNLGAWLTGRSESTQQFIEISAQYDELTPMQRYLLCNFDNVCSAIRKSVWKNLPFAKSDFGEDIEWGKQVIEQGWKIAYVSASWVVHSHERTVAYEFRRNRLCHRKLQQLFELSTIPTVLHLAAGTVTSVKKDWSYCLQHESDQARRWRLFCKIPFLNVAGLSGQYFGAKEARRESRARAAQQ